jgi:hypothetical protein
MAISLGSSPTAWTHTIDAGRPCGAGRWSGGTGAEAEADRDAQAVAQRDARGVEHVRLVVARVAEDLQGEVVAGLDQASRSPSGWSRHVGAALGQHLGGGRLGGGHVGLVEGLHAEAAPVSAWRAPASRLCRCPLGAASTADDAGDRPPRGVRAAAAARNSRSAPYTSGAHGSPTIGTTPVPSLPSDSATSCSTQSPASRLGRQHEGGLVPATRTPRHRGGEPSGGLVRGRRPGRCGQRRRRRPGAARDVGAHEEAGHDAEQRQRRVAAADVGPVLEHVGEAALACERASSSPGR